MSVHPQTVRLWRREFGAGGLDTLLAKPHPGPPCRLSAEQEQELVGLLESPLVDFDDERPSWTTPLIARLIQDRFGVEYPTTTWARCSTRWATATRSR